MKEEDDYCRSCRPWIISLSMGTQEVEIETTCCYSNDCSTNIRWAGVCKWFLCSISEYFWVGFFRKRIWWVAFTCILCLKQYHCACVYSLHSIFTLRSLEYIEFSNWENFWLPAYATRNISFSNNWLNTSTNVSDVFQRGVKCKNLSSFGRKWLTNCAWILPKTISTQSYLSKIEKINTIFEWLFGKFWFAPSY